MKKLITTDKEQKKRIETCKLCEFYNPISRRCRKCGCFMQIKTRLRLANCPMGFWDRTDKSE